MHSIFPIWGRIDCYKKMEGFLTASHVQKKAKSVMAEIEVMQEEGEIEDLAELLEEWSNDDGV